MIRRLWCRGEFFLYNVRLTVEEDGKQVLP